MIGIKKQTAWYQERTIKLNVHVRGMKAIKTLPKVEKAIFAHCMTMYMCRLHIKKISLVEAREIAKAGRILSELLSIKLNQVQTEIKNYLS